MNESQRKAYLNAMGIEVYYPRANLPGAKISPLYEFDLEEEIAAQVELSEKIKKPNEEAQARPLESDRSELIDEENKKKQVQQAEDSKPPANKTREKVIIEQAESKISPSGNESQDQFQTEAGHKPAVVGESSGLRFSLRYFSVSPSLAIIDEYPLQQTTAAKEESLRLLRNILRAIKVVDTVEVFSPEQFNWPLIEGLANQDNEAAAARQALQGFIAGRQQQDGFKNLLVLAGLVDDLLIGPESASNRRDYQMPNSEFFITVTQSLQSMLSYPLLKRDVWQQLQPLQARIQANK